MRKWHRFIPASSLVAVVAVVEVLSAHQKI